MSGVRWPVERESVLGFLLLCSSGCAVPGKKNLIPADLRLIARKEKARDGQFTVASFNSIMFILIPDKLVSVLFCLLSWL